MTTENKISEEMAKEQIECFIEYYGFDWNDIEIENGPEALKTMTNTLTRAIRVGKLEVSTGDGELKITQNLQHPIDEITEITYRDRVLKANLAMDRESSKKVEVRRLAFMSTVSDIPTKSLIKLKGRDVTIFNRITGIFSMV